MSDRSTDQVVRLDAESWRTLNQVVRRLESAWQDGRPELDEFVPEHSDPLRSTILLQLVKVDQELSWESGERRLLEDYLAEWPEIRENSVAIIELLEAECLNRTLADSPPDEAELNRRFPEIAARIDLQLIAAQAEEDRSRSDTSTTGPADGSATPVRSPETHSSQQLLPGSRFGRYEIRERIGHGSMGAVYRAWDTRLLRETALKVPHFDQAADPELIAQFRREAVAMAQVHHPAVCQVFDAFEVDGMLALTMACVEGDPLGDWMAHRRLDQQQTAELILAITRGVDAIHERGVTHRDIKPANIVINRRGEPVLTDFGLARRAGELSKTGGPGNLSGTPAYMSPEQIDGRMEVDQRSDVYSLGVLLFQMLTGSLPFSGDLESVLDAVCHQPPPRPSTLRSGLNRTLELICLKALEKQPDERFESAEAMAQSLESCLNTMRQRRQKHRLRLFAGVGAALVTMVAALAVYLLREPPKSDEEIILLACPRRELRIPGSDSTHRAVLPADGSRLIVSSRHAGYAPFRFFDTDTGEDGREFQFAISDRFYNDGDGFTAPRHDHMAAVLSHDGRYLYCCDYYANCVARIDLRSPDEETVADYLPISHRWAQMISLSPDGTRLIAATGQSGRSNDTDNNALIMIDVANGAFRRLAEVPLTDEVVASQFGFRGGSESVFTLTAGPGHSDPALVQVSLREPYRVSRLPLPGSEPRDLVVTNRRHRILLSDSVSRTIRVLDLDNLTDTGREYPLYGHAPGSLALNRDENILYVLCPDARRLICLDPATGEILGGAHGLPAGATLLHLSSDESRLWTVDPGSLVAEFKTDDLLHRIVFASNANGTHQIHAMAPGGSILRLSEGTHTERCPRWSPDGRRIAFISNRAGSNHICLMNRAGDGVRVLKLTDPVIGEQQEVPLDWSPDGTQIAFVGGNHKSIRVVDVGSGNVRTILNGPAVPAPDHVYDHHNGLAWSRSDGMILISSQVESYGSDQDVFRLDPATGKVTAITSLWGQKPYFVAPAVSWNGSHVAAVQIDPGPPIRWQACLVDRMSVRSILAMTLEEVRNPRWFPDAGRLVYSSGPHGAQRLFVVSVAGDEPVALTESGSDSSDPDVWSAR
ncbi:MAG: protein kinase [Planctomycetota bacterium]|nr:protein kinase [Planctomycetota bacterium]